MKRHFQFLLAARLLCSVAIGQQVEPSLHVSNQPHPVFEQTGVQYVTEETSASSLTNIATYTVAPEPTIRQLQQEIAGLKSQIQQVQYSSTVGLEEYPVPFCTGSDCAEGCNACGDQCRCCRNSSRLFGAVEIPFQQARISGAFPVFNVSPAADRMIQSDYAPSIRYIAEFRPEPTLGLRGRYFKFDSNLPFGAPFQPAELGIRLDSADLEFVFHQAYCRWKFDLSAGVQYGQLKYSADSATAVGVGAVRFEGVGPVFAMNAEHKLGNSNLALFGGVRASFLMGTTTNGSLLVNVPRSTIHDEMMQVYHNQLGVVWKPDFFERVGIAVRAGWETQFWMNDTFADDSYGIGSNLSLTGPMVSAEVSF